MTDGMGDGMGDGITGFGDACDEVLDVLLRGSGMEQWLVTRTTKESQRVLASAGAAFVLNRRSTIPFADSLCAQMIRGASRFVPSVSDDPAYATVPMALRHGIGSYVGAVVFDTDGTVFGTVVGLDSRRRPPVSDGLDRQVHLHAALLGARLAEARSTPLAVAADVTRDVDPVTGFATPASWIALRAAVERECRVLGDDAAVVAVRLGGLRALVNRSGHDAADEARREVAYALRTSVPGVAGRVDDNVLVAVARNRALDARAVREVLIDAARSAGLDAAVECTYRRWSEAGGLAAAERRARDRVAMADLDRLVHTV